MSKLAGTRMIVSVSVATVWLSPDSPRPIDAPALAAPVSVGEWLKSMSMEEKLDLYSGSRIQTQVLYGTEVVAVEEQGEWLKIVIPDQSTHKEPAGYPGWVPKCQLTKCPADTEYNVFVEVFAAKAILQIEPAGAAAPVMELSFLTRLPLLEERGDEVIVSTPHSPGRLAKQDVRITGSLPASPESIGKLTGEQIVQDGQRFLGLPYLWGGMSAYGYDCSGFAYSMHKAQGILIPRDASDQSQQGRSIQREELEPGDLLFFAYDQGKGRVHHVGIYAGENRMLHSPDSSGCIEIVDLGTYKLKDEHCVSRRYWDGYCLNNFIPL
ncbi:C40 family peptidase [Paenibacillus jiagnxiensis]|uniref:C40 family peptidase n=1 Tax=Paenibacillus jiagnxiensis TaxID=3228926 RepID=UPI0033B804A6